MTKPVLVAWALWLGIVLLIQAVFIFRFGIVTPFFLQKAARRSVSKWVRVRDGLVYLLCAVLVLGVAAQVILKPVKHIEVLDLWLPVAFVLGGIVFFVRPNTLIGWARTSYPDLAESTTALGFSRFIGAGLLFLGLLFLTLS